MQVRDPRAESPVLQKMGGSHVKSGDTRQLVLHSWEASYPNNFNALSLMKFLFSSS